MTTIAEAFVTLRPDLDKFKSETESGLSQFGGIAKNAALALAGIGTAAVAAAGVFIHSAAEEEAGVIRLQQALGNAGVDVGKYSAMWETVIGQMEKTTAFSDGEMRDSLSLLVAMTGDADEAMNRLSVAQDLARGTGMDLESASRLLGKITDENVNVLKRYGIEVKKGSDAQDVLNAVTEAFGGQAMAFANTAQGQWQIMSNQISNLKEDIGMALLPVFNEFVKAAVGGIDELRHNVLPGLIERFKDLQDRARPVLDFLGSVWSNVIMPGIRGVIDLLPKVLGSLGEIFDVLTGRRPEAGGVLSELVGTDAAAGIMSAIANVRTVLTEAFDFLKPIIQGVIDKVLELKTKFEELPEPIKAAFATLAVGQITGVNDALVNTGASIATMASGLINVAEVAPKVMSGIGGMIKLLPTWIGLQGIAAAELGATALAALPLIALFAAVGIAIALLVTHWDDFSASVGYLAGIIGHFAGQVLGYVGDRIHEFFAPFLDWLNLFQKDAPYAIGILVGAVSQLPFKIGQFIGDMISRVSALLAQLKTDMWNKFQEIISVVVDSIVNLAKYALDHFGEFIDNVLGLFEGLGALRDNLMRIAGEAVEGFISGIFGQIPRLVSLATDWAGRFLQGIKDSLGIHSPSTAMMSVGEMVMMGLAMGINQNADVVETALRKSMQSSISNAFDSTKVITAEELAKFTRVIEGSPISLSSAALDLMAKTGKDFKDLIAPGGETLGSVGLARTPMSYQPDVIDYNKLASAMSNVNLSVGVDDVHSALLRKQDRNAGLGISGSLAG